MKKWFIKILGGYTKDEVLTEAVKKLYNTIGKNDILQVDSETGQWVFMGKLMSKSEQQMLSAESKNLLNSRLWKILKADIQYRSNKQMFVSSQSMDDLLVGKSWLYVLDIVETRLKSMEKDSALYNYKEFN